MAHGTSTRVSAVSRGRYVPPGRFGRLFPALRSLKTASSNSPGPHELLVSPTELGAKGGPMDGGSNASSADDNPRLSAGMTFLGQFIDHDITFDPTSSREQQNDPDSIRNFRTPTLELDSMYGAGPRVQPYLYDGRGHLLLAASHVDVPRNSHQVAIIGDPRNDENLIVSQLHLAFMRFHNAVLDRHAGGDFEEAQRLVRWHYQWIVLNEYLKGVCGEAVVKRILTQGRRYFTCTHEPFIPVEFSVAAFRFGHSQARPAYQIQRGPAGAPPRFVAPLFSPDGDDLRGGRPIDSERAVDWALFFGPSSQRGKRIDHLLTTSLLDLPDSVVGPGAPPERRSLATRNLLRGLAFNLPSGQAVARHMGIQELSDSELWDGVPGGTGPAPLWFYILREAEVRTGGQHLAGVGAVIVAEVIIGLLECDHASFLHQWRNWRPTLPSLRACDFSMGDLLAIADEY